MKTDGNPYYPKQMAAERRALDREWKSLRQQQEAYAAEYTVLMEWYDLAVKQLRTVTRTGTFMFDPGTMRLYPADSAIAQARYIADTRERRICFED